MARKRRRPPIGRQTDFTSALGITRAATSPGAARTPGAGMLPSLGLKPPALGPSATGSGYATVPPRTVPSITTAGPASQYMTPEAQQQARDLLSGAGAAMRAFTNQGAQSQQVDDGPTHSIQRYGGQAIAGGANWLSNLFNSEDESDLKIGPANLAAVESTFDGFLTGMNWTYDRISQAGSWANAAAPGGTESMSWEEADDVSWGQSAVSANAQLTNQFEDRLGPAGTVVGSIYGFLTNPVGAPGSIGAITDIAPFTARGFDPTDPVQRKAAFEDSTAGRWASGLADTAVAVFADPTIIGGKVMKVAKLRYLDQLIDTPEKVVRATQETQYGGQVYARNLEHFGKESIEDLTKEEVKQLRVAPVARFLHAVVQREETAASKAVRQRYIDEGGDAVAANDIPREYTKVMGEEQVDQYLARMRATNREGLKSALFNARTYDEAEAVLHHAWGDPRAQAKLRDLRPDLSVEIMNSERTLLRMMAQADPVGLRKQANVIRDRYEQAEARLRALTESTADRTVIDEVQAAANEAFDLTSQADELVGQRARYDAAAKALKGQEKRKQPNTQEIANLRDEMTALMEGWEYVANGTVPPVGTGLSATKEEIELLQRSIDSQLQHNVLFQRSLEEARSHSSGLFGSLAESSTGFARGVIDDGGGVGDVILDKFGRAVEKSRQTRAGKIAYTRNSRGALGAEYDYAREMGASPAKALGEAVTQRRAAWKMDEFYGVNRFNPVARVWHWMGGERPSGTLTTTGIGAQESGREVRAMLQDIAFYNGRAVPARDKTGATILNADGSVKMVGGSERREALVTQYENALLEGGVEGDYKIRALLDSLEDEMMKDVAERHGLDVERLMDMKFRANGKLKEIETTIRDKGYWIDEKGVQNEVPWLETHLQNSTFMQNWRKIDEAAAQMAKRGAAYKAGQVKTMAFDSAAEFNSRFQDIWRPGVLLRGGYTQRNVAEGLFRAVAFQWSLAPLGLAGKQAGMSAKTTRAARKVSGRSAKAVRAVVDEAGTDGMTIDKMTSPRFQKWLGKQVEEADANIERVRGIATFAHEQLAYASPQYRAHAIMRKQEKAKIIREEIDALQASIDPFDPDERAAARLETLIDEQADLFEESYRLQALGTVDEPLDMDDRALADMIEWLEDVDLAKAKRSRELLDTPIEAANAYRKQTLAKRRVGDGSYAGPDPETMQALLAESEMTPREAATRALTEEIGGRLSAGAFDQTSSYSALALANSSADVTMKSMLAMRQQAVISAMELVQTRHYVRVDPTDPEYMDGVATVLNQIQHSGVGRIVIDGRAAGKADAAIHDDIVRYLSEDPEGVEWASILQQLNDDYFGGDSLGVRERWAEAMTKTLADAEPYAQAEAAARDALRKAHGQASAARLNRRKPRWEGDAPATEKRKWDDMTYGEHVVTTEGRGKWTVTNSRSGETITATSRDAARRAAKEAQDTLDAHWAGGPALKTDEEIEAFVNAARARMEKAAADHAGATARVNPAGNGGRASTGEKEDMLEYAAETLRRYDSVTAGDVDLQHYLSVEDLPMGAQGKIKRKGSKEDTAAKQRYATGEAGDIVRGFLGKHEGTARLQPVVGNMAATVGTGTVMDLFRQSSKEMFRIIGAVPENTMVRWPFYNKRYEQTVETLYNNAKAINGQVTLKDLNAIREAGHRRALKDTKDWLYTIDRRTNFGAVMENWLPFAQASQNSISTIGRLVWKDPAVAAVMSLIWNAPNRSGLVEDPENPNLMVIPLDKVPQALRDQFSLGDELVLNKERLDLIFQSLADPTATPLVAVASSEMMKNGVFGAYTVDGPEFIKSISESTGIDWWGAWKDRIYGAEQGVSKTTMSWDKVVPPWIRTGIEGFFGGDGSSSGYAATYTKIMTSEMVKWRAGLRDEAPTEQEITGRARWFTALRFASNLLAFTTPQYQTAAEPIINAIRTNDAAHAEDVRLNGEFATSLPSEELYGDVITQMAKAGASQGNTGAYQTLGAVDRATKYTGLISKVAPGLEGVDQLSSLGIILATSDEILAAQRGDLNAVYEPSAAGWQQANTVPGTQTPYREKLTGQQAVLNATTSAGWAVYLRANDRIKAVLAQRPYHSIESAANADLKADRQGVIDALRYDPNFAGWFDDFHDPTGSKAASTMKVVEAALTDPTFMKDHENDEVWRRGGIAESYLFERNSIIQYKEATKAEYAAKRITSAEKEAWDDSIDASWAETQAKLDNASPEWAILRERFFRDDSEPWNTEPGQTYVSADDFVPLGEPVTEGAR